jgi:uncharacterized protein YbjQ (UPF0145 family)
MELILQLIIFTILMPVGFFGGGATERRHFRSIAEREKKFLHLPAVTMRHVVDETTVTRANLVVGSAVISVDYYKRFLAGLRNLVGGEVRSYSPLMDRARREAILRMKEQAPDADIILNLRVETSNIGSQSKESQIACVEVLASGTAVWLRR